MYSSSFESTRLALVPILAVVVTQLLLVHNVSSLNMTNAYLRHKCYVYQGKYYPGSIFEKELISNSHSIPLGSNFTSGYELMSTNYFGNNFISIIHQCRGDSYGRKCRACYATALSGLQRRCPKYKGGIIWYDQCLLEISGVKTFGKIDYHNNVCMSNSKTVSGDQNSFNMELNTLLNNLTSIAIKKTSKGILLYAAGERRLETKRLYGMVQCTSDLANIKDCQKCVERNLLHFKDCLNGKQGARVLGRSCNLRYELYPFIFPKAEPNYLKI